MAIARNVTATGLDASLVAAQIAHDLAGEDLRLAVVFADWRIDPTVLARELQNALAPAPVVGCTTIGVIGQGEGATCAAMGLYGDWLRVGIGLAPELPKSALVRSRDAVRHAAAALGWHPDSLDPQRHAAITFVDGSSGLEEAFCIGSAAASPQIRVVGGSAATELGSTRRAFVWCNGEALSDAGLVVILESERRFEAVTSSHLISTTAKTVVTSAVGRAIDELDGRPAVVRLRELVRELGGKLDEAQPSEYSFARFVDGVPYVRAMTHLEGNRIHLASAVEAGHVLRLMQPGELIGKTTRDLEQTKERVGGEIAALLAFSCIARHWDAAARGLEAELAAAYACYPTTGFQSYGEQTGMLLVNVTLTGLAIGVPRS
jgi:hypothetical protein